MNDSIPSSFLKSDNYVIAPPIKRKMISENRIKMPKSLI